MPSGPGCLVFRVPSVPEGLGVPSVPGCLVFRVPSVFQPHNFEKLMSLNARHTWNHPETFHPRYGKFNFRHKVI